MGVRGPRPGQKVGGRQKGTLNKVTADVRAAAQQYTEAALAELARIALNSESDQARVTAIKELLDRGHGRSPQAITVDPGTEATQWLADFMKSIDGQSRGLPAYRGVDRPQLNH